MTPEQAAGNGPGDGAALAEPGTPAVQVVDVSKRYRTLDAVVTAADHVTLAIAAGSTVALTGPSGSGKSTLLHMIGALDRPDSGTITVNGQQITALNRRRAADYRAGVGFVFQRFNLLAALTVLDNVLAPALPRKTRNRGVRQDRARELIAAVGLDGRENTLATRLSGGQQQRVAIARALTNLILFDESSGKMTVAKGRSTPSRPDVGVLSGVDDACTGTTVPDAHYFLHGTTVGINALLERKGASWAC